MHRPGSPIVGHAILSEKLVGREGGFLAIRRLQLVNVRFANVENRVTLSWPGGVGELGEVLGTAAELLAMPGRERRPGALQLAGMPAMFRAATRPCSTAMGQRALMRSSP